MSAKKWLIENEDWIEEDFDETDLQIVRWMESYAKSILPEKQEIRRIDMLTTTCDIKLGFNRCRQQALNNINDEG